jgi:hypothetical protein
MANNVINKKVMEVKATNLLNTSVNTRSLMTVDTSLAETEGQTKTVAVYTYTGKVEKLADGEKNSTRGALNHTSVDYKVQRAQQVFDYTDSDYQKDNSIVDIGLEGANALMTNEMTADFYTECAKASVSHSVDVISYEAIVDGIAKLNIEDESKLFVVIPTARKADLRKDPDYKNARMGEVVYNGQIGTVAGIPVIATNAIDEDTAYVMTNEAVHLIMKEDVEVETDRDVETKTNTVVLSSYYIVALRNNNKICKINLGV